MVGELHPDCFSSHCPEDRQGLECERVGSTILVMVEFGVNLVMLRTIITPDSTSSYVQ